MNQIYDEGLKLFNKGLEELGIELSDVQIEQFVKFYEMLVEKNKVMNLTGITEFKQRTNLSGKGVLLGLIDSGIDYNLPIFKDEEGKSKILYYWDQSINGNPPEGFKQGSLYTNEDINNAINGNMNNYCYAWNSCGWNCLFYSK